MEEKESYLNIRKSRTLTVLFLLILGVVSFGLLYIFRSYLVSFITAFTLFFLLQGLHEKILDFVKKRIISSFIVIILLCIVIVTPVTYIMMSLGDQTYQLYFFLQEKINADLFERIQNSEIVVIGMQLFDIDKTELLQRATVLIRQYSLSVLKSITSIISFQFDLLLSFLCMILMLFFLFKDGANLASFVYRTLPFPDDIEHKVGTRLKKVINVLVVGNFFIMSLQGFMLGLGLYIAGFSSFMLWGVIGCIFSLIPVVGTSFVWIPAVLYLLIAKSFGWAIFVAVWSLVWYFLLENLLKPVVFGSTLNFHPLLFFFLLLGSIKGFGLAGVIIGPILLTLFVSLWEIYKMLDLYGTNKRKKRKASLEDSTSVVSEN